MVSHKNYLLRLVLLTGDWAILNLALAFSLPISRYLLGMDKAHLGFSDFLLLQVIWFVWAYVQQLYDLNKVGEVDQTLRKTFRCYALAIPHYGLFLALLHGQAKVLPLFLVFSAVLLVLVLISRLLLTYLVDFVIRQASLYKRIVIVGYNDTARRLAAYFRSQHQLFSFEGYFHSLSPEQAEGALVDPDGNLVLPIDQCIAYAQENNITEIYSTLLPEQHEEIQTLVRKAEQHCLRLRFVPQFETSLDEAELDSMLAFEHPQLLEQFQTHSLQREPLNNVESRIKKRAFDVVFSSLVIVFVISWLFPLIALLIKLESRGPILFKQWRSGKNNQPFLCYKFRSMRMNDKSDLQQASRNDERITRLGRFLRKTSLDELPQFINVLLGHMSVVGPRPHMVKHTEQYRLLIDRYMIRHFLKPGITGWAQVNGFRGETKDPYLMQKRVEHDIWYMENWSANMDIRIIFMTIINLAKGESKAF